MHDRYKIRHKISLHSASTHDSKYLCVPRPICVLFYFVFLMWNDSVLVSIIAFMTSCSHYYIAS